MRYLLNLLTIFISGLLLAQAPTIDWQQTFGGSDEDYGYAILATTDNYLLVGGQTSSTDGDIIENLGNLDAWLIKYDTEGNEIWKKAYGGSEWDVIWDIKETTDGNYMFFAISSSTDGDVEGNIGETDFWIVKINTEGEIIWENNYGGLSLEDGGRILQTPDNGYLMIGASSSNNGDFTENNGDLDYAILKINENGEIQWSKTFGGSEMDMALDGMIDNEGNILITGFAYSNDGDFNLNKGGGDVWVLKINPEGNLIWKKNIGGTGFEQSYCIAPLSNGNYIVGINSPSNDNDFEDNYGNSDIWLFYLNSDGDIINKNHFGGSLSESPMALKQLVNGDILVGSVSYSTNGNVSNNHGSSDFWIFKINSSGEIIWENSYGGSNLERLWGLVEFDNGYAAIGETESNDGDVTGNHGETDFWILKLNDDEMGLNENSHNTISVYPNPFSDKIYIDSQENLSSIEITDLTGKIVSKEKFHFKNKQLNTSGLTKGVYILKIKTTTGKSFTQKIVKR